MAGILVKAVNKSTYIITSAFTDADGTAVTPNALTWSLTDYEGNVINSRSGVVVTPAASVSIVLGALDLDTDQGKRVFTIEGTYNSATHGNNLPIREQASFRIKPWIDKVT